MNEELKQKIFSEIKSLEQRYKRNLDEIDQIMELQSDISSRIQLNLRKIHNIG